MEELEKREEMYWHQRCKQQWIEVGDRSTRFFHAKMRQRRQRNQVNKIRDGANNVYEQEEQIELALVKYFSDLFFSGGDPDPQTILECVHSQILAQMVS